ncbi:MAG: 50S ribosomal protein L30 [Bacteroidia bacterium]|nr:50S ribosomal protein L30 [Bacteroidia bacterium]
MAKIKITQIRSVIGRPARQIRTMKALGLRRINHTIVKDATPPVIGMVRSISHLIKVEEA